MYIVFFSFWSNIHDIIPGSISAVFHESKGNVSEKKNGLILCVFCDVMATSYHHKAASF